MNQSTLSYGQPITSIVSIELLDSLREYLNDVNYNPEFDLNNIINHNLDDINELDDLLKYPTQS